MTSEHKKARADKRAIDKGDYYLVYSSPEHIKSFSITWTKDQMKEKRFNDWLEMQKESAKRQIPNGYVLIDQYMFTNGSLPELVSKTFRYADPDNLAIVPKLL